MESKMLETSILNYIKSQGIFDQLRHECLVDIDKRPSYQNLVYKVEGFTKDFLDFQTWSPDINKNNLRDLLRQYINELPKVQIGLDYLVDKVVLPIIYHKSRTKLEKEIKAYKEKFGLTKKKEGSSSKEKMSKKLASEKDFKRLYEHYHKISKTNKPKNGNICRTSKSKTEIKYDNMKEFDPKLSDSGLFIKNPKYLQKKAQIETSRICYDVEPCQKRDCVETIQEKPCSSQRSHFHLGKKEDFADQTIRPSRNSSFAFSKNGEPSENLISPQYRNKQSKHLYFPQSFIHCKYEQRPFNPRYSNIKRSLAQSGFKEKPFKNGVKIHIKKKKEKRIHSSEKVCLNHAVKSKNRESYLDSDKSIKKSKKHSKGYKHNKSKDHQNAKSFHNKPRRTLPSIIVRRKDVEEKHTLWKNSSNTTSSSNSSCLSDTDDVPRRRDNNQQKNTIVTNESSPDLMYQLLVQKSSRNDTLSSFQYLSSSSSKTKSRRHQRRIKKRKKVVVQNDMYDKKHKHRK